MTALMVPIIPYPFVVPRKRKIHTFTEEAPLSSTGWVHPYTDQFDSNHTSDKDERRTTPLSIPSLRSTFRSSATTVRRRTENDPPSATEAHEIGCTHPNAPNHPYSHKPTPTAVPTSSSVSDEYQKLAFDHKNPVPRRERSGEEILRSAQDLWSRRHFPKPQRPIYQAKVGKKSSLPIKEALPSPSSVRSEASAQEHVFTERTGGTVSTVSSKNATNYSPQNARRSTHIHRLSNNSSACVHSMRTASMSNCSLSVVPRSLHPGFWNDNQSPGANRLRCSLDNDRPLVVRWTCDDDATRRGVRRRQIIDELILTEESYVADLKALLYLYSTLLASHSSMTTGLRVSVQKNVCELLHIHERLLAKFRRATFEAAARKWADTSSTTGIGCSTYPTPGTGGHDSSKHIRSRSSVDSAEIIKAQKHLGNADPIDVSDITVILRATLADFFVYEEYCANHDLIAQELHDRSPRLWSTYESGIESLARSLTATNQRMYNSRKGLTVKDLLIKPIQRICKYPLLLADLLSNTPVSDSPTSHTDLAGLLHDIREVVQSVNIATNDHQARQDIQRRSLLADRLSLEAVGLSSDRLHTFGTVQLCGVLHVAYQRSTSIEGGFMLCVLFDQYLLVAQPEITGDGFNVVALVALQDLTIESAMNGKGLQCASTLYTWKVCFIATGHLYEFLLSACSANEEEQWYRGFQKGFGPSKLCRPAVPSCSTSLALEIQSMGVLHLSPRSLSQDRSLQRAATVGSRGGISHVIVRHTHNSHDTPEHRNSAASTSVSRSQSHLKTKRVPVLEPKRSDRSRLESRLSDVWTKERLPYPGLIGSRSGQIIRASAGSLARKLSLASVQGPFSKARSISSSISRRKSTSTLNSLHGQHENNCQPNKHQRRVRDVTGASIIPEVDDMRSVVGRMIGLGSSLPAEACSVPTKKRKTTVKSSGAGSVGRLMYGFGPDDPAEMFYYDETTDQPAYRRPQQLASNTTEKNKEDGRADSVSRRKRRWSHALSTLKEIRAEAKNMLQQVRPVD